MPFAQLVVGPPGSGKSTYCDGMQQLLTALHRKCSVVNLDPANDHASYASDLDVRSLVSLAEVMEDEELGPNGGILYALEELEHNLPWLEQGLSELGDNYVLFDCPGQVELFTHHSSLRNIFFRLQKLGYRVRHLTPFPPWHHCWIIIIIANTSKIIESQLVVVNLIDSHSLTLPTLYISMLLLSLRSMLQIDLPQLNVLSKIDNLASYPPLPMPLSFYTEARSLEHILPFLEDEQPHNIGSPGEQTHSEERSTGALYDQSRSKFAALNEAIIELVDDYGLVGFETLAVEDRTLMLQLLRTIDRAGGYAFGGVEGANETVWELAVREGGSRKMEARDVEERWIDRRAEFDEMERQAWEEEGKMERGQSGLEGHE